MLLFGIELYLQSTLSSFYIRANQLTWLICGRFYINQANYLSFLSANIKAINSCLSSIVNLPSTLSFAIKVSNL
ncbi:hypothetical protein SAMN02583745_01948 [Thorsellia anophelis DSM 18579]|uniref:Uncharacterized protein n=1 Tax=Thorsellia anophelis DSM 18579 TaxID=1123402 RepID=A0A1I0DE56_9GAMM|nr:hypothetical protein SAMN02583745_01948 [Thorsellia anophelis DSM 18579]